MHRAGYEVTALDFAPRTIDALRLRAPEVNPTLGDVRALPFPDGSFDGYLSPGVIEHFYEGWGEVGAEAYRVLRPSGFFFVTFPAMSRLRRILLARGHYPQWESRWRAEFYQFALDVDEVGGALSRLGFSVHRRSYVMGLSGLEDAFPVLEPAIAKARRARRPFRAVAGAIGRLLEPVAGHIAIVVARKP
jgi:SAM-dependent methyltransferase